METEVKLAFKTAEEMFSIIEADWFKHYCLDTSERKSVTLNNTYFDTPDRKLSARGGSMRVRHYGDDEDSNSYEHTVKFGGSVNNGLHQRYEWNYVTNSRKFKIDEFKRAVAESGDPADLLDEVLEGVNDDDIVPLASTVFERTTYMFGYGDSIMEACFDLGKIEAAGKSEDICELELELESGDVVDLKDIAQYIVENTDAVTFDDSKFKRCLRLIDDV